MSATWDSKALKVTPLLADELLIIDTADSRNQKRATLASFGGSVWTRDAGNGFIFPNVLADDVGIGINTPQGKVHIRTTSAGVETPDADADDLIIENAGNEGYTVAPSVTIAAPQAVVTATGTVITIDGINKIFSLSGGSGYTSVPTVTFDAPGTGSDDTLAFATVVGGIVTAITITNNGSGYGIVTPGITFSGGSPSVAATAVSGPPGFVSSITPDLLGSGYHSDTPPSVTITASTLTNGTTATATPVFVNTEITSYTVTDAGSGYGVTPPTVTIDAPPAAVTATATAQIGGGKVTGITITNTPSGYKIPLPVVTITGGDGDGAGVDQITLGIPTSTISSITVTKGGAGITVFSPIDNVGVIDFSHPGFPRHGSLRFNHDTESFQLFNNQKQTIIADGLSNVGITSQAGPFTEKFTVDSDVENEPSIMMLRDTFDRLRMGYDGGTAFSTTETAAQVVVQAGTGDLNIASRGNLASVIEFYTSSGSALSKRMTVASNGFVGIGTDTPVGRLEVAGTSADTDFRVARIGNSGAHLFLTSRGGAFNQVVMGNSSVPCIAMRDNGGVAVCSFGNQGTETPANTFVVGGSVGVEIITPTEKVVISTSGVNDPSRLLIRNSTTTRLVVGYDGTDAFRTTLVEAQVIVPTDTGDLVLATRGNLASNLLFYTSAGSAIVERMKIDTTGSVGIGVTSPNSLLHVNGSFAVRRVAAADNINSADEVIIGVTDTSAPRLVTILSPDFVDGRLFIIKDESGNAGTNNITIATQGAQTIDGASSVAITADFGVARLYSDGSNLFLW